MHVWWWWFIVLIRGSQKLIELVNMYPYTLRIKIDTQNIYIYIYEHWLRSECVMVTLKPNAHWWKLAWVMLHFNWTHSYVFGQFLMLEQSHNIHHTTPISPGVLFGLTALDITGESTSSLGSSLCIIILLSSFSSNRDRISLWKALWISDTAAKADAKFSVTVSVNVLLRLVGICFSF